MPEKENQVIGYRVRNWAGHFEVAQSRRRPDQKNSWVAFPNKHDGKTFRRVTREENAERLFCAWCLIVEVASKCIPRGDLRDPDGWLTAEDLADKTGFRPDLFALALPFFASPRIAWLEAVQADPGQRQDSPGPDHGQTEDEGKAKQGLQSQGITPPPLQIGQTEVRSRSDRGQATRQTRQTLQTRHDRQTDRQAPPPSFPGKDLEEAYKKHAELKALHAVPALRGISLEIWLKCKARRDPFMDFAKAVRFVCDKAEIQTEIEKPGAFLDCYLGYYEKDHKANCNARRQAHEERAKEMKAFIEYAQEMKAFPEKIKTMEEDMARQFGSGFIAEARAKMKGEGHE